MHNVCVWQIMSESMEVVVGETSMYAQCVRVAEHFDYALLHVSISYMWRAWCDEGTGYAGSYMCVYCSYMYICW